MSRPVVISTHAREAMMLRRVSKDEVLETIARPEVTDRDRNGNTRYFRGKLCVVTANDRFKTIIVTVLYRYGDKWTDGDIRKRDLT